MCGITGAYLTTGRDFGGEKTIKNSLEKLSARGPDHSSVKIFEKAGFGHTRLKIIDTSVSANQPMCDKSGRYWIIFNGEIFNFHELRSSLEKTGEITFHTRSDTEVLLQLLIRKGEKCIPLLNGFFSFAFYDCQQHRLILARDRYGEKPLVWSYHNGCLYFASELKAMDNYIPGKTISGESLFYYFSLTYIPAPLTIYNEVKKLEPGHYLIAENNGIQDICWHTHSPGKFEGSYEEAKKLLYETTRDAVNKRMISDVPLGCFLSGGIDSTIVSGIAREYNPGLQTFSIGFPNEPYFDETEFALAASKHLGTKHEVIPLTTDDLYDHSESALSYLDEPFADSSSIAVYALSKKVREKITVCLSGDGADELFGGYNKHRAFFKAQKKNMLNSLIRLSGPALALLPQSRSNSFTNKFRQLKKYYELLKLKPEDRYWHLAAFTPEEKVNTLLKRKKSIRKVNQVTGDYMNDFLMQDLRLVLTNDMLFKVDMMSMANSLEIRPPMLDHRVVDLACSLPSGYKIDNKTGKKILRDTFENYLPAPIRKRGKKGFEVPVKKWITEKWKKEISEDLLGDKFIRAQGLFDPDFIRKERSRINRENFNESTAWSLVVFQRWWKKHLS